MAAIIVLAASRSPDRERAQPLCSVTVAGTGSARRRRRAFLLRLEPRDRRADRRERAVFVLLLAEAVGIGAVGRVDRLLQQVGEILVEAGLARPWLRDDVGRDVPGLLHRELRVQVVGTV